MKTSAFVTVFLFFLLSLFLGYKAMAKQEKPTLYMQMPGTSYQGKQPPLTKEQETLKKHLYDHVDTLSQKIGERNINQYNNLLNAANYIASSLNQAGYQSQKQTFNAFGKDFSNIIAEKKGLAHPKKIIIIGAHYDSVHGTKGADDNASGVAVLLEMARFFSSQETKRTIRFVAFVNEEPPFFKTNHMGSLVHAQSCKANKENIIAMMSLEMLGCYKDYPGSQNYPEPLSKHYPKVGNFIGFVGNIPSKDLVFRAIKTFRDSALLPSEGLIGPEAFPGISLSDQWSFWNVGYPAMMVTDTAFFRYEHYHQNTDTIDKLDFENMVRLAEGLQNVITDLVNN